MNTNVGSTRKQIDMQIAEVMRRPDLGFDKAGSAPLCEGLPVPAPVASPTRVARSTGGEPFGRWLLAQIDRGDWIDDLAASARLDPSFPKSGSPDEVRRRLSLQGADPDAFEQLDDAEGCWRGLGAEDC